MRSLPPTSRSSRSVGSSLLTDYASSSGRLEVARDERAHATKTAAGEHGDHVSTWLITGCSSGQGRALAEAVLAAGHNAVVTARHVDAVQDITAGFPDTALPLA